VEPQVIEQPLDLNIPENKIMLAFYVAAPEVENDRRALNVIVGMRRAKKEDGWQPRMQGMKTTAPIIIPSKDAAYVKEGFEELAKEIYTVEEVWKNLKKKGFKCSLNNFWTLLRNPVYTGKILVPAYKDKEEQILEGKHEAIITEELFYRVQDFLNGRKRKVPKKNNKKPQLPLRGFLLCPRCNNTLTGSVPKEMAENITTTIAPMAAKKG
jgi:site-specific DNA recombinase